MNTRYGFVFSFLYILFFVMECFAQIPNSKQEEGKLGYTIYIQPVAIIEKEYIYIQDIARVEDDISHSLLQRIATIPLWEAPKEIGQSKTFSEIAIRKKVKEVLGKDALFCYYPPLLTVQRGGTILHKMQIEERVQKLIIQELEGRNSSHITIETIKSPHYVLAKDAKSTFHFDIKKAGIPKSIIILNVVDSIGNIEQQIPITVTVNSYVHALCAKEYIERNTPIASYIEECMYNTALGSNVLPIVHTIERYRAKKSIPKGAVIVPSYVEEIPAIHKGANVELIYNKNGIRLSTKASALSDAYIGGRITVQTSYSKKNIYATVIDKNTVQIP